MIMAIHHASQDLIISLARHQVLNNREQLLSATSLMHSLTQEVVGKSEVIYIPLKVMGAITKHFVFMDTSQTEISNSFKPGVV